jgi:hypothetical protein
MQRNETEALTQSLLKREPSSGLGNGWGSNRAIAWAIVLSPGASAKRICPRGIELGELPQAEPKVLSARPPEMVSHRDASGPDFSASEEAPT